MDYSKYYFLDNYLNEVRNNFLKNGFLMPEEFFCIVIWKANRAKTKIKKRLLKRGRVKRAIKELTNTLYNVVRNEDKLKILTNAGFMLPMATAILTVLYPKDFSIYDVRVREQLSIPPIYSNKKYFSDFLPKIKDFARQHNLSLRDTDKYLWGKSFYEDLEKFLK